MQIYVLVKLYKWEEAKNWSKIPPTNKLRHQGAIGLALLVAISIVTMLWPRKLSRLFLSWPEKKWIVRAQPDNSDLNTDFRAMLCKMLRTLYNSRNILRAPRCFHIWFLQSRPNIFSSSPHLKDSMTCQRRSFKLVLISQMADLNGWNSWMITLLSS